MAVLYTPLHCFPLPLEMSHPWPLKQSKNIDSGIHY